LINTSSLDNTNSGIIAREKYAERDAATERVISLAVLGYNCEYRVVADYKEEWRKTCATAMASTGGRSQVLEWLALFVTIFEL
jgi:hypothetical protein